MLAFLKSRGECSLKELMAKFGVSSATIHRDVHELARRDAVSLVRGGIVFRGAGGDDVAENGYGERFVANRREKAAVADRAVQLVQEGDIIFLDLSTTTYEFALRLRRENLLHLTVVSNSVAIMSLFRRLPSHWTMLGLGGSYDPQLHSLLGKSTEESLSRVNVMKAFVSAFGVDDRNVTTNHERQAELLRAVLSQAEKRYLLVDHTKIGRVGIYKIVSKGALDMIVTD